jgi:flagellar motor switch protein FliN/FliY
MPADLRPILKLEVPLIVVLGWKSVPVREVTALGPGSIVELPKQADEELEILVNNKVIGTGRAVKVGENFGVRITYLGDLKARVQALGDAPRVDESGVLPGSGPGSGASADSAAADADALAEQMLAGQS